MAEPPIRSESPKLSDDDTGIPRWVKVLGLVTLVVVLLLVVFMLVGGGGGGGGHGPGRHTLGDASGVTAGAGDGHAPGVR